MAGLCDEFEVDDSSSNFDSISSEASLPAASVKPCKKRHKAVSHHGGGKKRRRKYSPTSDSSEYTPKRVTLKKCKKKKRYIHSDSESSDSVVIIKKKKKKKQGKVVKDCDSHHSQVKRHRKTLRSAKDVSKKRRRHLLDVFQKHYDSLVTLIQICPQVITNKLFAKKIISGETLSKIVTGCDSKMTKASTLLCDVRTQLNVHPEKLIDFVNILKEENSLDFITEKMMNDLEGITQDEEHISHSGSLKVASPISRYREYLLYYYHNDPIVRDDKLAIAPCSQFISLALIKKFQKRNDAFSKSTLHGGVDEILARKSPVELDSILSSNSTFVLVEGPPGIGKSTLCWELCRKWNTFDILKAYEIVLQLKLREKRVQCAVALPELFYHEDLELRKAVVDEINKCEGSGVLLILDGFDEMPISVVHDDSKLIMKLISGKCLPLATRLITSRPSALHRTKYFPREYRHIEILGFTDEHKRQFAEIAFESEPEILVHFMNFVLSNPVINSLMYIPVNCAIIAQVYKDIRGSSILPKSMTQLYSTLVLVLIRRYMIEKGIWDEESRIPTNFQHLPQNILSELKRVSTLAHGGLLKEDVQLVFFDDDIPDGIQYLGLLKESKEMYVSEGVRTSYSFLHLSIQEFLAAWHVSCHPDLAKEAVTRTFEKPGSGHDVKPHLDAFGRFLAGMIGCDSFPIEFTPFKYVDVSRYIINCFYEAQNVSYLRSLPDSICWRLSLSTPLDMYVFGFTLVHAPIQWKITALTEFRVLLRSLSDNASPADLKIVGLIKGLILAVSDMKLDGDIGYLLLQLKGLPLDHLTYLALRDMDNSSLSTLSIVISSFSNLQRLGLIFKEQCEEDIIVCRALRSLNLTEFELSFLHMSIEGLQEVSKFISNSSTLQSVNIQAFPLVDQIFSKEQCDYYTLLEATLSCTSVQTLYTNIPFRAFDEKILCCLKDMTFEVPDMSVSVTALHDCLCCIADLCKIRSMRCLRITHSGVRNICILNVYKDFISILNDSLHQNPSMEELELLLEFQSEDDFIVLFFSSISGLRQDPNILRLNLKRPKSLCDLVTITDEFSLEDDVDGPFSDLSAGDDERDSLPITQLDEENSSLSEHQPSWDSAVENFSSDNECQNEHQDVMPDEDDFENEPPLEELTTIFSNSCPDLREIEPVLDMHPLLYTVLSSREIDLT